MVAGLWNYGWTFLTGIFSVFSKRFHRSNCYFYNEKTMCDMYTDKLYDFPFKIKMSHKSSCHLLGYITLRPYSELWDFSLLSLDKAKEKIIGGTCSLKILNTLMCVFILSNVSSRGIWTDSKFPPEVEP